MTFQMQSWSSRDQAWAAMEDGPARSRWAPKPTAIEAAQQCIEWTGTISIPAMQVRDLTTGEVVWRDSRHYPDAGPSIFPEWDSAVREEARKAWSSDGEKAVEAAPAEPALFDLTGGGAA